MQKLIILLFFILSFNGFSQNKTFDNVSIDDFISETQFGSDSPDDIEIIWWVPTEYWNIVFAQDPSTSDTESQEIIDMVKDYVVIMAIKGKIGIFGGITYNTKEEIKAITNVNYNGENLYMLEDDEINPDMINFISMIQPMMKNMIGPMGDNMQIFLYQSPKEKKILPIDPYSNNNLIFKLGSFEKGASLPLGCLLEEKLCPENQEELSGKWNFCPIHGSELKSKS